MSRAVIGILDSEEQVKTLLQNLELASFKSSEVSVLFPDKRAGHEITHHVSNKAPEGAVAGVSAGGVLGGTLGLLAGIGAIAIPGLGPFLAAGPVLAALSAAAAGAAVAGVAGALIGWGIPEVQAKAYEGRLESGNILVAVHTETAKARALAEELMSRAGAHDIAAAPEARPPT